MAAKYWLKLYYEMLDDPKIGRLPPALKWRFVECLLVAGETDEGGFLPDVREMAWRVREDGERYETELNELTKAGLLSKEEGRYLVTSYSKRQAAVSGAERVAKYRERQKKQEYYEPETGQERNGNDIVTNRYTDIDTDIDTDKKRKDIDKSEYIHNQEIDPEALPDFEHQQKRQEMVSSISGEVRTIYAPGKNNGDFETIADALISQDIPPERIKGFNDWWQGGGSWYKNTGKASLDHFFGAVDDYLSGATKKASKNGNGANGLTFDEIINQAVQDVKEGGGLWQA